MAHHVILDAHVHAWDAGRLRIPWTAASPSFAACPWGAYRAACAGTGIEASVIVEADVLPEDRLAEAQDFAARHGRGEVAGAVACLDPRDGTFESQVQALAALGGIRGVRWIARRSEDAHALRASPVALAHLRLLGELGLTFDLNVPPGDLAAMAPWIGAAGGTRIVLDHCGNADAVAFGARQGRAPHHDAAAWERGIAALAALPHVACKISGIVTPLRPGRWAAQDLAPIVERCLAAFGPQRVLFGSDWPVCTLAGSLRDWLQALQALVAHRPAQERQELFGDGARRWYGLPAPTGRAAAVVDPTSA